MSGNIGLNHQAIKPEVLGPMSENLWFKPMLANTARETSGLMV